MPCDKSLLRMHAMSVVDEADGRLASVDDNICCRNVASSVQSVRVCRSEVSGSSAKADAVNRRTPVARLDIIGIMCPHAEAPLVASDRVASRFRLVGVPRSRPLPACLRSRGEVEVNLGHTQGGLVVLVGYLSHSREAPAEAPRPHQSRARPGAYVCVGSCLAAARPQARPGAWMGAWARVTPGKPTVRSDIRLGQDGDVQFRSIESYLPPRFIKNFSFEGHRGSQDN